MVNKLLATSILAADFAELRRDIEIINKSEADWFHIDVMDGVFVPNISFGMPVIKAIKKYALKPIDVHLMIEKPERYIKTFKSLGADYLSIHYEACVHLHRTVYDIKDLGMKAGIAFNIHSSAYLLKDIIKDLDLVVIMSVNPGFCGHNFIADITYAKIFELRELIKKKKSSALLEIDGGIWTKNSTLLFKSGADVLVAGSAIFNSSYSRGSIRDIKLCF